MDTLSVVITYQQNQQGHILCLRYENSSLADSGLWLVNFCIMLLSLCLLPKS